MNTLYDTDYVAWVDEQISLLRNKDYAHLDMEKLLEEMEDMGGHKSSIGNYLHIALTHMLKMRYTPERDCLRIWQISIDNSRDPILDILEDNPSLKKYPSQVFEKAYRRARKSAAKQTGYTIEMFPVESPWTIEQVLGE